MINYDLHKYNVTVIAVYIRDTTARSIASGVFLDKIVPEPSLTDRARETEVLG